MKHRWLWKWSWIPALAYVECRKCKAQMRSRRETGRRGKTTKYRAAGTRIWSVVEKMPECPGARA